MKDDRKFAEAIVGAIRGDLKDFRAEQSSDGVLIMFREPMNPTSILDKYATLCKRVEHIVSLIVERDFSLSSPLNFVKDFEGINRQTLVVLDDLRKEASKWGIHHTESHVVIKFLLPTRYAPIVELLSSLSLLKDIEGDAWLLPKDLEGLRDVVIGGYLRDIKDKNETEDIESIEENVNSEDSAEIEDKGEMKDVVDSGNTEDIEDSTTSEPQVADTNSIAQSTSQGTPITDITKSEQTAESSYRHRRGRKHRKRSA